MTGPLNGVSLHLVDNLDELDECRRWLGNPRPVLCADTESGGLNPHFHRHRLTQLGDKWHGWAFPPAWFGAANEMLSRYRGRLGFFNSPYDVRVIRHQDGVQLNWAQIDDAQSAGHIINSRKINKLKPRAADEIDPRAMQGEQLMKEGMRANHWNWDTVPGNWAPYWRYGALDPVLTAWMLEKYMPTVLAQFGPVYDLDMAYARLAANMMSAGMMIDIPYIHDWAAKTETWAAEITAWLRDQHGITSPGSNDQVGRALEAAGVPILARTPTGLPKVDKETLDGYAAEYPHAAPLIRSIQGAVKSGKLTKLWMRFLESADADGIVHYSIHPVGAMRTSRSSITDPAMQTFDRDVPQVRGSFIPRPGHVFISIDADQIELRLSAIVSGDQALIAEINRCDEAGESFFLNFASSVFGPVSKSDPRYTITKNTVYSMTYGAGKKTAAMTAGVPVDTVAPIYDGFKSAYRQLDRRSRQLVRRLEHSRGQPFVNTMMGRRLYVDRGSEYAGVDYEIQGSAAEFLKQGAVDCDAAGYGELLRLPIHDELLLEAPIADAPGVLADVTKILTRRDFPVPLTWSGGILDTRWMKT